MPPTTPPPSGNMGLGTAFGAQGLDEAMQQMAQVQAQRQLQQAQFGLQQQKEQADEARAQAEQQRQQQDLQLRQQMVQQAGQSRTDAVNERAILAMAPNTPMSDQQVTQAGQVGLGTRTLPLWSATGQLPTSSGPDVAPPTATFRALTPQEQNDQDFEEFVGKSGLPPEQQSMLRLARLDPKVAALMGTLNKPTPGAGQPTTEGELDAQYQMLDAKKKQGLPLSPAEQATYNAYSDRKLIVPDANAPDRQAASLDRSYQYNATQLENLRKPFADRVSRLQAASEAVTEKTPQADALVAPALLTGLVGGAGSGVRMNQAEIDRIMGGRSAWENLKATVQHWDPNAGQALQITPAQRQQIQQLLDSAVGRNQQALSVVDGAGQDLIDAPDVKTHRQVVQGAKTKLDQLSTASAGPGAGGGGNVPPQVLSAGPGRHTFANGQIWDVAADGKSATQIK